MKMPFLQNVFKSDEDQRAAQVILTIIFSLLAAYAVIMAMSLYWKDANLFVIPLAGCLLMLAALGLLARGYLRYSRLLVVLTVLVITNILATIGQGIRDIVILTYPGIVVIASLLMQRRDFIVLSLLSLASLGWLVFGEVYHWYTPTPADTWVTDFIGIAVIMGVIILATDLLAENMRKSLRLAQQRNEAREKAETNLRSSEEKYRDLVENIDDIVFALDVDGRITFLSSRVSMFGYEPQQFVSKHISEFMSAMTDPADRPMLSSLLSHQMTDDIPLAAFRIVSSTGQRKWLEITSRLQHDAAGNVTGRAGIMRDVTVRKEAERAAQIISDVQLALLRPSTLEEIYTLASKKVQELIGDCVTGVSLLDESDQVIRAMGYHGLDVPMEKISAIFGRNLLDTPYPVASMTHNELRVYRSSKLERLDAGLHAILVSFAPRPLCVAVEKLLRVKAVYAIGFVHQGEHLGAIVILSRVEMAPYQSAIEQIVNLSAFAIARKRAEEELQESELRLRNLSDHLPAGMVYQLDMGKDGQARQFKYVSAGIETLHELTAEAVYQDASLIYQHLDTLDQSRVVEQEAQALAHMVPFSTEVKIRLPSGTSRWSLLISAPRRAAKGNVLWDGLELDITERKRAEEALVQRNAELTTLNQLGQELNQLAEPAEILERIYTGIGQALDNRNLYIALYDPDNQYISFPIYMMDGQRRDPVGRKLSNGITDYIIRHNTPVLFRQGNDDEFRRLGIDLIGTPSRSFVGVPMRIEERVIGVIAHQDYEREYAYDQHHIELLMTVAGQASIALENARLYGEVQRSERRLEALIENGLDYISLLDVNGKLLWESPSLTNMLGYGFNEFLGKNLFEIMHPDDLEWVSRDFAEVAQKPGSRRSGLFRLRHLDGSWRWTEAIVNNCLDDPAVGAIVVNYRDVTERKKAEEAVQLSEARYRQAITAAGAVPYYRDYEKGLEAYTFMGDGIRQLTGYSAAEITPAIFDGLEQEAVMRGDLAHLTTESAGRLSESGNISHWACDYRILTRDGQTRWVADSAVQVHNGHNQRIGVIGILQDITERKQAEEKLRAALEEKETLLREVHHRVKNNLQAIMALIRMRREAIHDDETRQFLKELEGQARTMSLVYEQLYQAKNLSKVSMESYLQQLASHVLEAFGRRSALQLNVEAPVTLDMEKAMPCGLIVNELLNNILKHAFPVGYQNAPRVEIAMRQEGDICRLSVGDNGVGLPRNQAWDSSKSLGMRLVRLWATHQLGGRLDISTETGTNFVIVFDLNG